MTIVRKSFHIASVSNGEDAVSYEIVPSTSSLLIGANGNWVDGTTMVPGSGFAKVTCSVYKVVGTKRELCTEELYYTASSAYIKGFRFNNGIFYLLIPRTATVVDASVFVYDAATAKPIGDPLAMISIPVIRNGTNGDDGASLTCQYSSNGTGNWHDDFRQGTDFWMRQKLSTDADWSAPMRIIGEQGVKGKDGSYTEFSYGISSKDATDSPTTSPTDVSEWFDGPQKTTAKKPYLWMTICKFSSDGKAGTRYYTRINGKDGTNGTSISIKGKLDNSGRLPTSGATLGDCYLIAGELWVYVGGQEGENTDDMKYGFVNCGSIKGDPGDPATQYFYHVAWANSITKQEDGTIVAEGFTTSNPAGAAYAYMGVCYTTDGKTDPSTPSTYKWVKVEGKPAITCEVRLDTNTVTLNEKTGKFVTEKLGKFRYIKHVGGEEEEINSVYLLSNNLAVFIKNGVVKGSLMASGESDIMKFIASSKIALTDIDMVRFFWYDKMLLNLNNDPNATILKRIRDAQGIPPEDTGIKILASNTFTVLRQPIDGERGSAGAIWRQHKGFVDSSETEPYEYMAGGNDEKFIDVVLIGKIWYRCILKYESTGRTDTRNVPGSSEFGKYWSAADMSMEFIATDFLLAENAKINLFGSNEINLYSSNEDGRIFGSFRVPNGNGDGPAYALWLGAETGSEAPFSVTNRGYLKATDAEISGTIMAKGGSIGGFKINEDALGSNNGYNMYLTNNFIHFGNWGAFFHNAGYSINLGYQNRHGVEVSSFSSDTNDINVGGYFCVTANSEKDKGGYCAALELASMWATGAGDIDMTDAEKGNHAILIRNGDVAGLRPSFVRINKSKGLSCYNYNIECYNANDITLTLPDTEGAWGQHLVVIQRGGGKVIFTSTNNIHDLNANKDSKTWFSGTRGQVSYFWFNGTEWLVRYINK